VKEDAMNIRTNAVNLAVLAAVGMVTLTGCVSRGAYIESVLGESLAQTKASQTLNPEASLNTDPVTGLDGQSATNAINSYEQSFKSQASPSTGAGVGGMGGSGSSMFGSGMGGAGPGSGSGSR
jgi:hypothetical protein